MKKEIESLVHRELSNPRKLLKFLPAQIAEGSSSTQNLEMQKNILTICVDIKDILKLPIEVRQSFLNLKIEELKNVLRTYIISWIHAHWDSRLAQVEKEKNLNTRFAAITHMRRFCIDIYTFCRLMKQQDSSGKNWYKNIIVYMENSIFKISKLYCFLILLGWMEQIKILVIQELILR